MLILRSNLRSNQGTNLSLNLRSSLRSNLWSNRRSNLASNERLNLGWNRGWYFRAAILSEFLYRHEVDKTIIIINIFLRLWICKCWYKIYVKISSSSLGSLCENTQSILKVPLISNYLVSARKSNDNRMKILMSERKFPYDKCLIFSLKVHPRLDFIFILLKIIRIRKMFRTFRGYTLYLYFKCALI